MRLRVLNLLHPLNATYTFQPGTYHIFEHWYSRTYASEKDCINVFKICYIMRTILCSDLEHLGLVHML